MKQKYRVTGPRPVLDVEPGEEFEVELSASEEADYLNAGRLEILPRRYQVVGASNVWNAKPGEFFEAAIPKAPEAALLDGGHIERADKAPKLAKPNSK